MSITNLALLRAPFLGKYLVERATLSKASWVGQYSKLHGQNTNPLIICFELSTERVNQEYL